MYVYNSVLCNDTYLNTLKDKIKGRKGEEDSILDDDNRCNENLYSPEMVAIKIKIK